MRILVTGSTGFLGKHLIRKISQNHDLEIRALVRTSNQDILDFLKDHNTEIFKGDITDKEACIQAGKDCEIIIHMAAFLSDWDPWKKFHEVNVRGAENILESAIKNKVKQFIFISTNDVYGFSHKTVITEDEKINPDNFGYCKSKAMAQIILQNGLKEAKIPLTILYPLWIFGPEDKTFIPGIIEILQGNIAITIGKKTNLVPLTYVKNLVYYIEKAIGNSTAYNRGYFIGLEEKVLWKDFYQFFIDSLGFKPKFIRLPRWFGLCIAGLIEFWYWILPLKSRPPITRYVIKNFGNRVIYSTEKVRKDLGPPPYNLEKSMKETFDYFKGAGP